MKKNIIILSSILMFAASPAFAESEIDSEIGHTEPSTVKTEEIKPTTRTIKDSQLPLGVTVVVSEGTVGTMTYYREETTAKNASQDIVGIPVTYTVITQTPEERVVREGTKNSEIPVITEETIASEKDKAKEQEEAQEQAQKEAEAAALVTEDSSTTSTEDDSTTVKDSTTAKSTEPATDTSSTESTTDNSSTESTPSSKTSTQSAKISSSEASGTVTTPAENKAYAQSILPESDFTCADKLVMRESEWSTTAKNSSSGAYGVPQSLPGNKMASAGSDWQTNGKTQFNWMITYVDQRYGGFCQALNHSNSTGWY